jgi:pimeloyl-ACP methyl ester carboxylesterase
MMPNHADESIHLAQVRQGGRNVRLEYHWVGVKENAAPLLVFLHEGLGSASMWRHFPAQLCEPAAGAAWCTRATGYGRSTPRPHGERWTPGYMHEQARKCCQHSWRPSVSTSSESPYGCSATAMARRSH